MQNVYYCKQSSFFFDAVDVIFAYFGDEADLYL